MDIPALLLWKSVAVAGWVLLMLGAERVWPAARAALAAVQNAGGGGDAAARAGLRRVARNLGLWSINTAMSPFLVIPITVWAQGHSLGLRPDWWAGWPGLLLDLLLLDLAIYWWHRANHQVPLLWRFHGIHHLDGFLDVSTALRFHFGEVLLSALARAAVIVLLDLPVLSVVIFEALVLVSAAFHHADLRLPPRLERALRRVIVTPGLHAVHHHAVRADTDSNYGTTLSLWDRLFGSYNPAPRPAGGRIGVEGRGERPLAALLLGPFRAAPPAG